MRTNLFKHEDRIIEHENLETQQKPASKDTAVVRSFLDEMAKKHQCPIDQVVVGIVYNEMHIWRYNEGAYEKWQQLEIISL